LGGSSYPRTRGIALAATFAALLSVTSPISIPIGPVPITLQVFLVYLAAALLGPNYGALSILIYLALGVAGLPVFAGLSGSTAVILGPTGGYLFGFLVASFLGGAVARHRSSSRGADSIKVSASAIISLVVIYALGVLWLMNSLHLDIYRGLALGAIPFIPVDLVKAIVAVPIAVRLRWSTLRLPVNEPTGLTTP
jgi:biotin transport system substrate-specific component